MLVSGMLKSVFAKFSKKPKFEGDLIPLNDPVFDILRASEIGLGLLALNDDTEQRIYRSPYGNLTEESSMAHRLKNVCGYYLAGSDSILIAKSLRDKSIIDEADTIAHELAHRLQTRHFHSLNFKSQRYVSGYKKIVVTLLKEMHSNNIADLVLMQAHAAFKASDRREDQSLAIGIENHLRGKPAGKIVNDKFRSKDITPLRVQNFFVDNFKRHLSELDHYAVADLKTLRKGRRKNFIASGVFAIGGIFETFCSLILYSNDAKSLGAFCGAVAILATALSLKTAWGGIKQSKSYKPQIDPEALFEYSGVRLIPSENLEGHMQWPSNDNNPEFLQNKVDRMIKAIDDVREKGPVLSGEELRGRPMP